MNEIVLRAPRLDEVAGLCTLTNRSHTHDGVQQVLDEAELTEELGTLDVERDARVAELGGRIAGYAYIWFKPAGERLERAHIFGTVDPKSRGGGVGRTLLRWGTERATELLRTADPALPKYVRVEVYEQIDDARRLVQRLGFAPARWFEELLRPLDELPVLDVDEGYEIASWPEGRDDEVLAVRNEAFADHWGSTPWTADRFREIAGSYGTRLDVSVVAIDRSSGDVVGVCLNEHYPQDVAVLGRSDGWISVLGTRAAHRGRGLASAMLNASLHRFAGAGFTHASIGVGAASPTGANLLYRRLGFDLEHRHITYQIEL